MITDWRKLTQYEIGRTPNHIYLRPHRLLQPYIAHYTIWTQTPNKQQCSELLTLVPDASGCLVLYLDGAKVNGSLWGATTKVVTVESGTGGAPVRVFIEFLPGGLYQLTGMGQAVLTDGIFSLQDVLPHFFAGLNCLLEISDCVEQLVTELDKVLLPIMLLKEAPCTALFAASVLRQKKGLLTVESLASQVGYSPRHINRVLKDYLGMGAKQFGRLLRINAAVGLFGSDLPLTYLAQEAGFYDQAHFIRDFSEICGVTPGSYREKMSDFYNEPLKF